MYLVEYKCGDFIIKKYVADTNALSKLIETEMTNYEYIKVLKEFKNQILNQNEKDNLPKKR